MSVKIKSESYSRFPYVDTFRRYDPDSGILYNDDEEDSEYEGHYILADTGGGTYTEIDKAVFGQSGMIEEYQKMKQFGQIGRILIYIEIQQLR
jgi:hypothetical protein